MTKRIKRKCECNTTRSVGPFDDIFMSTKERKAQVHTKGQCPGDVDVKLYRRGRTVLALCSMCHVTGDVAVAEVSA